ncbi:Uncharacterised protein [Chlamydia trachomatis]|nr:Uncharacterised protein [Chlamydia trachomatis]
MVVAVAEPITFFDALMYTVELASAFPVTIVVFVVTVLTVGLLGAVLSATVTVLIELIFPALSVAVTDRTFPDFCFFDIVTVKFPALLEFALPKTVLPVLTVTDELASALPVTFTVLSPTVFTDGLAGAVLSATLNETGILLFPDLSMSLVEMVVPAVCFAMVAVNVFSPLIFTVASCFLSV